MSVEAISWALNLASVPAGRDGQPSSPCKFVLVGLANHAGPDGTAAFPSVRTLMRYTGLAERTVRACLARLDAAGVISPCDPAIIAARIRRADRRPKGWDLNLTRIRADLADAEIEVLERQFPGLAARITAAQADHTTVPDDGVHAPHPIQVVDSPADGVQEAHPVPGTAEPLDEPLRTPPNPSAEPRRTRRPGGVQQSMPATVRPAHLARQGFTGVLRVPWAEPASSPGQPKPLIRPTRPRPRHYPSPQSKTGDALR